MMAKRCVSSRRKIISESLNNEYENFIKNTDPRQIFLNVDFLRVKGQIARLKQKLAKSRRVSVLTDDANNDNNEIGAIYTLD